MFKKAKFCFPENTLLSLTCSHIEKQQIFKNFYRDVKTDKENSFCKSCPQKQKQNKN